jgi:hypothetical protein
MATIAWFDGWTIGHGCVPQTGISRGKAITNDPPKPISARGQNVSFQLL